MTPLGRAVEADGARSIEIADPEGNRLRLRQVGAPTSPPRFMGIAGITLLAADPDGLARWYRDVLDVPFAGTRATLPGGTTIEIAGGGVPERRPKPRARQAVVSALLVDDLAMTMAALDHRDVSIPLTLRSISFVLAAILLIPACGEDTEPARHRGQNTSADAGDDRDPDPSSECGGCSLPPRCNEDGSSPPARCSCGCIAGDPFSAGLVCTDKGSIHSPGGLRLSESARHGERVIRSESDSLAAEG